MFCVISLYKFVYLRFETDNDVDDDGHEEVEGAEGAQSTRTLKTRRNQLNLNHNNELKPILILKSNTF